MALSSFCTRGSNRLKEVGVHCRPHLEIEEPYLTRGVKIVLL